MPGSPRRYTGLVMSVVLHALVIALVVVGGQRLWLQTASQGGPGVAGARSGGGGGGSRLAYITLPSLPKAESAPRFKVVAPIPPPTKTVKPPDPAPVPVSQVVASVPESSATAADTAQPNAGRSGTGAGATSGQGSTAGAGNGLGPGTGTGTGTGGGGQGGTLRPPEPRDMAFPFDAPPKELRGVSLNVTFWVRDDGQVERYQVDPKINDREYAKKFDQVMRAFRFTPARAPNGTRVAGTATISFTLPGKSSS